MTAAKRVLIKELTEDNNLFPVADVIMWALEAYVKKQMQTGKEPSRGSLVAYSIVQRVYAAEKNIKQES